LSASDLTISGYYPVNRLAKIQISG